jgi:hypothetical protein
MDQAEYRRQIQAAYDGEVRGEVFFRALADQPALAPMRGDWLILARLEAETRNRMKPLIERLGLDATQSPAQAAAGRDRAERWRGVGPAEAIERLRTLVDPYLALYDGLAEAAADEDRETLNYVAAHERALSEYARLMSEGQTAAALAPVLALLPDARL